MDMLAKVGFMTRQVGPEEIKHHLAGQAGRPTASIPTSGSATGSVRRWPMALRNMVLMTLRAAGARRLCDVMMRFAAGAAARLPDQHAGAQRISSTSPMTARWRSGRTTSANRSCCPGRSATSRSISTTASVSTTLAPGDLGHAGAAEDRAGQRARPVVQLFQGRGSVVWDVAGVDRRQCHDTTRSRTCAIPIRRPTIRR